MRRRSAPAEGGGVDGSDGSCAAPGAAHTMGNAPAAIAMREVFGTTRRTALIVERFLERG